MKKTAKKNKTTNIKTNIKKDTKRKDNIQDSQEFKWLKIGGIAAAALIVVLTIALLVFYDDPTVDHRVARVGSTTIRASDIEAEIRQAENALMWNYFNVWEGEEIDYERVTERGVTFGRAMREEAVRLAALTKLHEEYAARLDITLTGNEDSWQIMQHLIPEFIENPEEFEVFEPYMPIDETADAESRANDLLARAHAGEDFDTLIATYGEDPGMQANPEGYTFTSGVMVSEFEQATRELSIGEISGLVSSQFGIHIIKRVEPNPDDVMGEWDPDDEDAEELLGAKHILISTGGLSLEERMMEAISSRFDAMIADTEIVFLSALDNVPVEPPEEPDMQ